ncbi:alpha/beta fold hydrolase [Micromonospora terminaliae]|uniref:Alpha/beta fold hydrolase n=1 Tax=Micromonospora terminaliae TaxID=1914461 RepID=A0AAJ2ZF89_9ACTN|nr:alpha/beta fold hydrolase [Micromonospora terminaliae]NES29080.1 alpha/beta fold hydrolase [Micromonospora terminaliae]QGL48914.1 alpha/beta fold hydrolase [Micromonospora terminaliae]
MSTVARPAIVLVHGTRFARGQWQPQLPALAAEFPVAAVDLPGHGRRAAEPWNLDRAADIVAEAIHDLDAGPALVVGHSLGGYVSLHFARRHPDLLAGLVLMGASLATTGPLTVPYRLVASLVARLPAARLTRWNDRLLRRLYPAEVVDATIADGYAFHTLPVAWRDVLGRFDASSLTAVHAPVLILNGERDRLFRSGEHAFAAARPGTRIELIPGAAHLANFDNPAAVTDALRRFARELSPSR